MSSRSQEEINTTKSFQDGFGGNFEDSFSTASVTQKTEMLPRKPEKNEKFIVTLRHGYEALKPQCVLDYNAGK